MVVSMMSLILFWRYTEKRNEVLRIEKQVKNPSSRLHGGLSSE